MAMIPIEGAAAVLGDYYAIGKTAGGIAAAALAEHAGSAIVSGVKRAALNQMASPYLGLQRGGTPRRAINLSDYPISRDSPSPHPDADDPAREHISDAQPHPYGPLAARTGPTDHVLYDRHGFAQVCQSDVRNVKSYTQYVAGTEWAYVINGISQGTDFMRRIGRKVTNRHLSFALRFRHSYPSSLNTIRVMVIVEQETSNSTWLTDKNALIRRMTGSDASDPAPSLLVRNGCTLHDVHREAIGSKGIVLFDKIIAYGTANDTNGELLVKGQLDLPFCSRYKNSTYDDDAVVNNRIWICYLSSDTTVAAYAATRLYFKP